MKLLKSRFLIKKKETDFQNPPISKINLTLESFEVAQSLDFGNKDTNMSLAPISKTILTPESIDIAESFDSDNKKTRHDTH